MLRHPEFTKVQVLAGKCTRREGRVVGIRHWCENDLLEAKIEVFTECVNFHADFIGIAGTRVQDFAIKGHILVRDEDPQERVNLALKNHQVENYGIDEVEDVHDVVVLKDFDVANEEYELEEAEVDVLEDFLGESNVAIWTGYFENSYEEAVEEAPAYHHKYKNYQAFID